MENGSGVRRVAALYDIHGNLPALEAVLEEVRQSEVDEVVVGGDVVPGPMPTETIARLLDLQMPVRFIRGNGDREILEGRRGSEYGSVPEQFRESLRWTARRLDDSHERLLASWPRVLRMDVHGIGQVLFCHATPANDTDIFTRLTPVETLAPIFDAAQTSLVVCGHTHMAFDRLVGRTRIVNAGSVGMPFGEPGAYWLLLGPRVEPRHTLYDLDRAADRIRETSYPDAARFAARHVLNPPSEQEMLDLFSRVGLR